MCRFVYDSMVLSVLLLLLAVVLFCAVALQLPSYPCTYLPKSRVIAVFVLAFVALKMRRGRIAAA